MDIKIKKLKNEVQSKIGRNILLLQKVEYLFKFISCITNISGYSSELKTIKENTITIDKRTLGQLINSYFENDSTYCNQTKTEDEANTRKEIWHSFGFWCSDMNDNTRKESLKLLLVERNELIHNFVLKYDLTRLEDLNMAEQYLDEQYRKIQQEFKHLKWMVESWQEMMQDIVEIMASSEGKQVLMLEALKQSQLVKLLIDISTEKSRADGWTYLSYAGSLVRKKASDELDFWKNRYGNTTLKNLMMMTGIFEIYDEPTNKGQKQVIYKIKPSL